MLTYNTIEMQWRIVFILSPDKCAGGDPKSIKGELSGLWGYLHKLTYPPRGICHF